MITFRQTMDYHSESVYRGDEWIASIQWHSARPPRIVWYTDNLLSVDLSDVEKIVARLKEEM